MNAKIDQQIKGLLNDLRVAHGKSEQFIAKELIPGEEVQVIDFFSMALAYDNESRILMYLEQAYCQKYPDRYSPEEIKYIEKEIKRLTHSINAWQNHQFPS